MVVPSISVVPAPITPAMAATAIASRKRTLCVPSTTSTTSATEALNTPPRAAVAPTMAKSPAWSLMAGRALESSKPAVPPKDPPATIDGKKSPPGRPVAELAAMLAK